MRKLLQSEKGMTLMEILVVIVIIGLLMGFLMPRFGGFTKSSQINAADTDLRVMKSGIQQHYIDSRDKDLTITEINQYSDFQVNQVSANGVNPIHFETVTKKDPWGNPYQVFISNEGERYASFVSYGPDSVKGVSSASPGDDIILVFYPRIQ